MALLFVSVVINYLDRANLSIAAPLLGKDLAIDSVKMGLVFSAFGWSYVFCQVPGGWLVDRVHPRTLYAILIALWSVATALLGFSAGLAMLFALRLAIGALEAPSFPINNRVVTTWFPERERATAIGFYTSGQFVGLAFLTPRPDVPPGPFRLAQRIHFRGAAGHRLGRGLVHCLSRPADL